MNALQYNIVGHDTMHKLLLDCTIYLNDFLSIHLKGNFFHYKI